MKDHKFAKLQTKMQTKYTKVGKVGGMCWVYNVSILTKVSKYSKYSKVSKNSRVSKIYKVYKISKVFKVCKVFNELVSESMTGMPSPWDAYTSKNQKWLQQNFLYLVSLIVIFNLIWPPRMIFIILTQRLWWSGMRIHRPNQMLPNQRTLLILLLTWFSLGLLTLVQLYWPHWWLLRSKGH